MAGDRSMEHHHQRSIDANRKAVLGAIFITGTIMVAEAVGGWLSGSLALISDAGHMLTDVLALGLSLLAIHFAAKPTSSTRTYGFYRMEILAALINGSALVLLSFYLLYEAYLRLKSPPEVDSALMLVVAGIGLLANLAAAAVMMKQSKESLNLRGAYLHIISDALSSVGVLIGGAIILWTKWYVVDPIISILICMVIVRGAIIIVRDAVNILLEAVPRDLDLDEIRQTLLSISGVKDVHHFHIWTITSGLHAMSAHVIVDDIPISRAGQILQEINEILKHRYGIVHTTLQVECDTCQEGYVCSLDDICLAVTKRQEHEH